MKENDSTESQWEEREIFIVYKWVNWPWLYSIFLLWQWVRLVRFRSQDFLHVSNKTLNSWNIDKDSIAWHPTLHFYPLSSTFLLMAFICVNCCPTQFRTEQTNSMSECAVHISVALTSDLDYLSVEVGFCHDLVKKLYVI